MKARVTLVAVFVLLSLVVTACGTNTAAKSSGPVEVKVDLVDFAIHSSITTFTVGVKYHFVVTNQGAAAHELMIVPASTAHASEEEIDSQRLFEVEDIAPGQTKTLDYTFTQATPAGTLEMACHEPGHYEAGMRLDVSVNK